LLPGTRFHDGTAGVGGDSPARAHAGLFVVASDRDSILARCAAFNLEQLVFHRVWRWRTRWREPSGRMQFSSTPTAVTAAHGP